MRKCVTSRRGRLIPGLMALPPPHRRHGMGPGASSPQPPPRNTATRDRDSASTGKRGRRGTPRRDPGGRCGLFPGPPRSPPQPPAPGGGHPAHPAPQQGGGCTSRTPFLSVWGQEFGRSCGIEGRGERKSCWGSQSRPGCFRRDPGPRLKSHRKQDLTPLVPASRELWFWSRFDFEDCRKITVSPL